MGEQKRSSQILNLLPEPILSYIYLSSSKNILFSAGLFAILILWGGGCYAFGDPFLRLGLGIGLSYYFFNLKRIPSARIVNLLIAALVMGLVLGLLYSLWITLTSSGSVLIKGAKCPETGSIIISAILFVFWLVSSFFGMVTLLQF